jgi:hypothetical protein
LTADVNASAKAQAAVPAASAAIDPRRDSQPASGSGKKCSQSATR